jgi:hypothetical protein
MKPQRIQFDLSPDQVAELDGLIELCGLASRKDLFNNALSLFQWVVQERLQGRRIASISDDETSYREIQMPALMNVRKRQVG